MRYRLVPLAVLLGIALPGLALAGPRAGAAAQAESTPAVWISPTPDETGAITVVVQPNESMWVIAARASLMLADLFTLNNLTESSVIRPGDVLIIGYGTPSATAVQPELAPPTATRPPPTPRPTSRVPAATVCLSAFDDTDQDGLHDAGEALRAGVAFTVYDSTAVVANYITDGASEPGCIEPLPPGEYRVTRSIAPGETLTTQGDWTFTLSDNSRLFQAFGSYTGAALPTPTPAVSPPTSTPAAAAGLPGAGQTEGPPAGPAGLQLLSVAGILVLGLGGLLLLTAVLILLARQQRDRR